MQYRIESAGAELVSVPGKFLDKPKAEDLALGSMVQNMKADQTCVQILIRFMQFGPYHRMSLSKIDITRHICTVKGKSFLVLGYELELMRGSER